MDLKDETPSKSKNTIVNKVLTNSVGCDSPFRLLPNISTPPSRFTKIINPFESHLIERLHLPTFSPSVFAQVSTPKTEEKFKWTIDDISSLKPADIDEATISQHVFEQDPTVESIVQEKIDKFFNDKVIVPSPMSEEVKRMPLIQEIHESESLSVSKPQLSNSSAQTVLTLPPKLPKHLEELLKPYFTYTQDQQQSDNDANLSLYRKLFEFDENEHLEHLDRDSIQSSPALSTGLSPIQLSPLCADNLRKRNFDSPMEMPELRDCNLSPIGRSPGESRSACRLSFSENMSIDASLVVPDVNQMPNQSTNYDQNTLASLHEVMNNSTINWDMEYKHVSILSHTPTSSPEKIDNSNSNTPHSKMFTSQRKRLSDSFKDIEFERDIDMDEEVVPRRNKSRLLLDDVTDAGYHTGGVTLCENSTWNRSHMFASTPTKSKD